MKPLFSHHHSPLKLTVSPVIKKRRNHHHTSSFNIFREAPQNLSREAKEFLCIFSLYVRSKKLNLKNTLTTTTIYNYNF